MHALSPDQYFLKHPFLDNCWCWSNHKKVVNIYIVFEISISFNISNYATLEKFLFRAVTLNKNADVDKYKYSGYGIGLDKHGSFSFPGTGLGRNVIMYGVDTSSSREKRYFDFG